MSIIGTLQAVAPALATELTYERLEMMRQITALRCVASAARELALHATCSQCFKALHTALAALAELDGKQKEAKP